MLGFRTAGAIVERPSFKQEYELGDASQTLLEIANHLARQHPELRAHLSEIFASGFAEWAARDFSVPCPRFVKESVLKRLNLDGATWVETGTFLGDTTQLLAEISNRVITIEPEPTLYQKARIRFADEPKVVVVNDISENALPSVLRDVGGNVCFWLDGHYSGGITFRGPNDTPLVQELNEIERHIQRFAATAIAIDDIRVCGKRHEYGAYPSLDYLVDWAKSNGLDWHIEYDIFIARSR
jgi:hypothetical protein